MGIADCDYDGLTAVLLSQADSNASTGGDPPLDVAKSIVKDRSPRGVPGPVAWREDFGVVIRTDVSCFHSHSSDSAAD